MKKISYILLITQLIAGFGYSQSGWIKQDLNPNEILSSIFFVNENTGFIGSCGDYTSNIYKTTNAGLNWFTTIDSLYGDLWSVYFLNINTGFAAYRGDILKTTNSGESWTYVYEGNHILFSILLTCPDTGYACGKYYTVLKTTNGGLNWLNQVNNTGYHQDMSFADNNNGYIVSEGGSVTKTTNGGLNWVPKSVYPYSQLYSVHFINESTGFCGGWFGVDLFVSKTTNAGENWAVKVSGPNGRIYRMTFANVQTGYAVGTAFLNTTNSGETWQIQDSLWGSELYSVCFINSLTGFASGYDYVNQKGVLYKTTTGGEPIGVQPISEEIPNNFVLHQNYPNPFNPVTKIKFEIPEQSHVKLIVYDLLGRQVVVLVNSELSPNFYEVQWNSSNYTSGIYFYRLETDKFTQTKKMVLLK